MFCSNDGSRDWLKERIPLLPWVDASLRVASGREILSIISIPKLMHHDDAIQLFSGWGSKIKDSKRRNGKFYSRNKRLNVLLEGF